MTSQCSWGSKAKLPVYWSGTSFLFKVTSWKGRRHMTNGRDTSLRWPWPSPQTATTTEAGRGKADCRTLFPSGFSITRRRGCDIYNTQVGGNPAWSHLSTQVTNPDINLKRSDTGLGLNCITTIHAGESMLHVFFRSLISIFRYVLRFSSRTFSSMAASALSPPSW